MSEHDVDVGALLAPIAEGAGEDPRADKSAASLYYRLRDALAQARDEDRQRDSEGESEGRFSEQWRQVRRLATEILETRGKDFEVAAWLAEALVRLEGLSGLTASAELLAGLLDQHWDAGHPQPDEDGLEGRSFPLAGLDGGDRDGTLLQPLRRTALFNRPSGGMLGLYQYEAAVEAAGLASEERKQQRYAQGVVPLETIETEARFARDGLRRMGAAARAARTAWAAYEAQADQRFGADAPTTRRVAGVLERLDEVARQLGGEAPGSEAPGSEAAAGATTPEGMTAGAPGAAPAAGGFALPAGNAMGREQALRLLEQVAEYFQRTEPHSFLAYTLQDAARRGRMGLPELLAEVMPDEAARTAMLTALGIRPHSPEG